MFGEFEMVASQSNSEPAHNNDMYCSAIPNPYGEYYPTTGQTDTNGHYYHVHHHPPPHEMCPQHHQHTQHHQQMCTLHGDYGKL